MATESNVKTGSRDESLRRLDDAARAGWLYYVAGKRQDEIARIMGISRQSAQRLVSMAVAEKLIKVHVAHPIARCMELAEQLRERFGLSHVEIVPDDPLSESTTVGVAEAAALEIERRLRAPEPKIFAIGTGRTLKVAIDQLPKMECPQHKIVSLAGNVAPDGSATFYSVIFTVADAVKARSFPLPLPVIASSAEERAMLHKQPMIDATLKLAQQADVAFVGVGDLGPEAPMHLDGFVSLGELEDLQKSGAVGEICGWAFDAKGVLIEGHTNARVASGTLPSTDTCLVIGLAKGKKKLPGVHAAIIGGLINGLITDEASAEALLAF